MTDTTLKSCPFCGKNLHKAVKLRGGGYRGRCAWCDAAGAATRPDRDMAVSDWNTRTPEDAAYRKGFRAALDAADQISIEDVELHGGEFTRAEHRGFRAAIDGMRAAIRVIRVTTVGWGS